MSRRVSVQVLYIPGLGDNYDRYRNIALKSWRRRGLKASIIPMNWRDRDETYEQKLRRVQTEIRKSSADRIVLIGESAGGSIVVNEGLRVGTKVDKVITICGKNLRADRLAPSLALRSPAFKSSLVAADRAVAQMKSKQEGRKFSVFYSQFDPLIWLVDTRIPGATLLRLPTMGHLISIVVSITVLRRRVIKEAILDR